MHLPPLLRLLTLTSLLALGGCTSLQPWTALAPGAAAAEVQARLGPPQRSWPEADGGRTLEYSSQPRGWRCLMLRLDATGRLVSIEDTLQPAGRARVQPGMTPEQVSRLLGIERSRVFFRLSGEDVWDWNIEPDPSGYKLRFNVHFKDGVVLRTSQSLVVPDPRFPLMDD